MSAQGPVTIAVIDYHKGNLRSMERGLADAGAEVVITDDPAVIRTADGLVLPGVGAFADASAAMRQMGQVDAVREQVARGIPFLGVCLGLQLAFDWGDEGCAPGERAEGLDACLTEAGAASPLFAGIPDHTYFYFTHSYVAVPDDPACALATTEHSERFTSAFGTGRVYGTQFHPEKSSTWGLALLKNYVGIVATAREERA